jgi:glutamate-ammonia-ligase adenylyltransferase
VGEERARAAHDAYRRLRQLQHGLRLKGEQYARIAPEQVPKEIRAVRELWESVMANG